MWCLGRKMSKAAKLNNFSLFVNGISDWRENCYVYQATSVVFQNNSMASISFTMMVKINIK